MIEKGKKYNFEELKEIFLEAQKNTIRELSELVEGNCKAKDPMFNLTYNMQNMMALSALYKVLFTKEEE